MITTEEILHLADLARMELSTEEAESFKKDISGILEYVGQVKNATGDMTEKTVPTLHNVMRADVPTNTAREYTEDILLNAPAREGDYVKVKKIL